MFLCYQCSNQFEDSNLAYTIILESRLGHPAEELFRFKFCCKTHVQEFLERVGNQQQRYVLTKVAPEGDKTFGPAVPLELLLLVGSTVAS